MKIVILDGYTLNPGDLDWGPIRELGECVVHDRTPPGQVVERSRGADVVLTNKVAIGPDALDALPGLRLIAVTATGYNMVDTRVARERGVAVCNVPEYGTPNVAQHAFALLLELTNQAGRHARGVSEGRWPASPDWCYWDAPLVELTPRPSLLPPTPEEGWSLPHPAEEEKPRGRTLLPGDPSLSPEVLLAEEKARVTERVQTWTTDQLAELRVRNGLVHPYFSQLRASLEKQLEDSPLFDEAKISVVHQMVSSYMEEAERYGSGRSPGRPVNERAPPSASERLEAVSRGNPAHDQLRAFMAAGERVQQLADSNAELVVIVEMQQGLDGQLSSVKVVEPSGNKAFDKYVLDAVPPALVQLTPPPPEATQGRTRGIRTLWAVEGRVVYLKRLSEMEGEDSLYLVGAAALGLLAGRFEETTGDIYVIDVRNPTFDIRPRLLRLW